MLRKKLILLTALLAISFSANAEDVETKVDKDNVTPDLIKDFNLDSIGEEGGTDLFQYSNDIVSKMKDMSLNPSKKLPMEKREGAGIANATMRKQRNAILEMLGLSDEVSRLYVLVSSSMPDEMIKSYVQEAMWSGGIIVFRGIDKGDTLAGFMRKRVLPLIKDKGAAATITIDPRLFDVFKVKHVPTIVHTSYPDIKICANTYREPMKYKGKSYDYDRCEPIPDDKYWKISGAVTIKYALEQFVKAGDKKAQENLDILTNTDIKGSNGKEQKAFDGDWNSIPVPEILTDYFKDSVKNGQSVYETKLGPSIGPPGLENTEQQIIDITDKYK